MNWQEHLVEIMIACLLLFIFPLIYFSQKQDTLVKSVAKIETVRFLEEIRSLGYLSNTMYQNYLNKLATTGLSYDIQIEHKHKMFEPEYRFRNADEIKEAQDAAYTGNNHYYYRSVHTEIPKVIDSNNYEGNLNSETNESVLAVAMNVPPDSSHVHTEACYLGHRHTDGEGIYESNYQHGCYNHSYHSYGSCPGYMYFEGTFDEGYTGRSCKTCGHPTTTLSYGYRCGTCSFGAIFYYSYSCQRGCPSWEEGSAPTSCPNTGSIIKYRCLLEEDLIPDCSHIITNITPNHPKQTIYTDDPLITTVIATYLDGSQRVVLATTDFQPTIPANQVNVTLNYSYTISEFVFQVSCSIEVDILPRGKVCVNDHFYHLNSEGSDPGCPYCDAWLHSLEVEEPLSGSITIFKGTTLQDNGVTLVATYLNGRKEYLDTGYIDNLDMNYVGLQTVTLSYKGKYTYLTVITKRKLKLCDICNRYYELYPDNSDPGCPYCAASLPIFTGNVMDYMDKRYLSHIMKELQKGSGIYYFSAKDYIRIQVKNKTTTIGSHILSLFYRNLEKDNITITYSGYIREDGD